MEDSSVCKVDTNRSQSPRLPLEILLEIVKHSDQATLVSWTTTNSFFRPTAEKLLWRTLQVKYRDLKLYDAYIFPNYVASRDKTHLVPSNRPDDGGIVHALAHPPTDGPASRSRLYVKELVFKLEDSTGVGEMFQPYILDNAIASFISCLPRLESCSFEGIVYDSTLEILTRVRTLHTLEFRTDNAHGIVSAAHIVPNPHGVVYAARIQNVPGLVYVTSTTTIPFVGVYGQMMQQASITPMALQFSHLSRFPMLRKLYIGQLRRSESLRLRAVLPTLQIETLEIAAANRIFESFEQPNLSPFSALFHFNALQLHSARRLPSTLKSLVLRDAHGRMNTLPAWVLLEAIRPCSELAYLEVSQLAVPVEPAKSQYMDQFKAIPTLKTIIIEKWYAANPNHRV